MFTLRTDFSYARVLITWSCMTKMKSYIIKRHTKVFPFNEKVKLQGQNTNEICM